MEMYNILAELNRDSISVGQAENQGSETQNNGYAIYYYSIMKSNFLIQVVDNPRNL